MPRPVFSWYRFCFLTVLVTVFILTYVADLNIFTAIIHAISFASPYVEHFILLFLILSVTSLCVYYYLIKISHQHVSHRLLAWLKIFMLSFFTAFAISALIVYLNIYFDHTFDVS